MADNDYILTPQGYERLQAELNRLEARYAMNSAQLAENFREVNDGTEPTDHDLFEDRRYTAERIERIKQVLALSEVIDANTHPGEVSIGDAVVVRDVKTREEETFVLLSGAEVTERRAGVAADSPVGKALLGKQVGDTILVDTPDGTVQFEICRFDFSVG